MLCKNLCQSSFELKPFGFCLLLESTFTLSSHPKTLKTKNTFLHLKGYHANLSYSISVYQIIIFSIVRLCFLPYWVTRISLSKVEIYIRITSKFVKFILNFCLPEGVKVKKHFKKKMNKDSLYLAPILRLNCNKACKRTASGQKQSFRASAVAS